MALAVPVWLSQLFGTGIIDRILSFIPNPEQARQAKAQLEAAIVQAAIKAEADQRAINLEEAKSKSVFVAGWRPGAGWLCVAGLAWQFFVAPILTWFSLALKIDVPPLPMLGDTTLTDLLYALLGVASLRSFDKYAGTDTGKVLTGRKS